MDLRIERQQLLMNIDVSGTLQWVYCDDNAASITLTYVKNWKTIDIKIDESNCVRHRRDEYH